MRKTLYLVVTHYGDHQLDYERFFFDNRSLLREAGIACPWLDEVAPARGWETRLLSSMNAIKGGSSTARAELLESVAECDGILLALPVASMWQSARDLLALMRTDAAFSAWADTDVRVLWLARERGAEAEGGVIHNLPMDSVDTAFRCTLDGAESWLAHLDDLLGLADELVILEDSGPNHVPMAQVLEKLGISLPPERVIPLRETRPLPRAALWCAAKLRAILPYGTDAASLPLEALTSASDNAGFLSPDRQAALHAAYAPGLTDVTAKYSHDLALPAPAPTGEWQPFIPPAPAECRKVYEAYLKSADQEEREYSLRLLENAWDAGWLCADAPAYAAGLRDKYGIPQPDTPLLSVLTLTKNHAQYIASCMDSVLMQDTTFPVRHIIVDDASTDGTRRIVEEYARKHPSICPVFLNSGHPAGDNVRALFTRCSSTYAALCDGDDYFTDKDKLQMQVDFLEANPDCTVCFHPVLVSFENNANDNFIFPSPKLLPRGIVKRYYLADLSKANFIQTNSVVYRWRFREGLPEWFRADICPGDWYWHMLHAETGKIGFIPRIMSVYRRHHSALYMDAFVQPDKHWRTHGMNELQAFHVFNEHFHGRYFRTLSMLANQVLSSFLNDKLEGNDTGLFDLACATYPKFGLEFLKNLKLSQQQGHIPAKDSSTPVAGTSTGPAPRVQEAPREHED